MKNHQISRFFKPAKRKLDAGFVKSELETLKQPVTKKQATEKTAKPSKSSSGKPTEKSKKLTPLETQILDLKQGHQDKILAIQVGYKYKFFGEDARIVSKIVNIMLIPSEDSRFNYCLIPDNRLHVHLKNILNHGYKVGVVKQVEQSMSKSIENSKGLFSRKLTGVYTLATYMDEEIEDGRNMTVDQDNGAYIMCVNRVSREVGIVVIRPLTGEIIVDSFEDDDLHNELETRLVYFKPSECIVVCDDEAVGKTIGNVVNVVNNTCRLQSKANRSDSLEVLETFFQNEELEDISLYDYYKVNFNSLVLNCVAELVSYMEQFQLSGIFSIPSNIQKFENKDYMILSSTVLKTLEIFENSTDNTSRGSLIYLLNHTRTRMGERLLNKWVSRPLTSREKIQDRFQAIEDLSKEFNHFIDCLKNMLKKDTDLERTLMRLHYSLTTVKISRTEVYKMLLRFDGILKFVKQSTHDIENINKTFKSNTLKSIFNELLELSNSFDIEGLYLNLIRQAYGDSTSKDQKHNYFDLNAHEWVEITDQNEKIKQIEQEIEEETKEVSKVLGKTVQLVKNMNQEHLIEVRNTQINRLPVDWIRINATKTITRFRSPKLQKLNNLLIYNHELLDKACDKAFITFLKSINENYFKFSKIIRNMAKFDCFLSLSVTKAQGKRPEILEEDSMIDVKDFKNPIISTLKDYITNNVKISPTTNRISLITGPNMGGKSSYIKSIGILVVMNQVGCYLPCESARLSIFNQIFVRMGSFDNIIRGQSTFMVEMLEVLNILKNYDSKSLILLDEIGRGTGTFDGYLIAYAILKYFCTDDKKAVLLFITHFHKLAELANEHDDIGNFYMDFLKNPDNDEIIFLYKLVSGVLDNLFGLNVAKLAGIPESIISRARDKAREVRNEAELKRIAEIIELIKRNDYQTLFNKITLDT